MSIRTSGLYAAGAIGLGVIGLVTQDFALQWQPVAAELSARAALACLSAVILIVGGLMTVWPRTSRYGAAVLAAFYALWIVALHLPKALAAPADLGVWLGVFEILALASGGAVLLGLSKPGAPNAMLVRVGRLVFGFCPLIFGLSHLVYASFTAAMVPAWIPGQLFWAYATGVAHVAAGLAILSGIQARLASALLAVMCGSFVVLLHLPRVIAATASQIEWTMMAVALSLTGAAWIVSTSYAAVESRARIDA